jgi:hypothetical protein
VRRNGANRNLLLRPAKKKSPAAAVTVSAFTLSRTYAEGWNAARKLAPGASDKLNSQALADLNPYPNEPERSRWADGFTSALEK